MVSLHSTVVVFFFLWITEVKLMSVKLSVKSDSFRGMWACPPPIGGKRKALYRVVSVGYNKGGNRERSICGFTFAAPQDLERENIVRCLHVSDSH